MLSTGSRRPCRRLPTFAARIDLLNVRAVAAAAALAALIAPAASAQWATFVNDTANRMPSTLLNGLNPAGNTTTSDNQEKDFAWADLDNDGDTDLVLVRKIPFTFFGGRTNVLFLNENGVLRDRTLEKASSSINVPPSEITAANAMGTYSEFKPSYWAGTETVSRGFLDPTNDRDVVIGDVNNDGWLDVVTATTISDVTNTGLGTPYYLPRFLGHPRVYINKGEIGGVWQGLEYDYNRIPQLTNKTGTTAWHPRFCSVAIGDVTGDGYADLYFGDYDSAEVGPDEPAGTDFDNKLLINRGAAGPGVFDDSLSTRIGLNPGLLSAFGAASVIADMNGDGKNDIVKQTGLNPPQHVAITYNDTATVGIFGTYQIVIETSPYFVSAGDLNNDGRLDLVITDDGTDHYHLNQGNPPGGVPTFNYMDFSAVSGDDGFGSQSAIADLDNDGFKDVLISDVDVDGFGCGRRLHIYRNLGNVPNVSLVEQSPLIIPAASLQGTYHTAPFDINNDGWIDLVIGRCNTTEVWMNTGTKLTVPSAPTLVNPSTGTTFQATIDTSAIAPIVAGSARLYYSINGGAFTFSRLSPQGGSNYLASLPAGQCGDDIRYYIEVKTNVNGTITTFTNPVGAPTAFYTALRGTSQTITSDEPFERGVASWTVSNDAGLIAGAWTAVDPIGTLNAAQQAAPEDDATPAGTKAFVTMQGVAMGTANAADVDGSATHLLSPTLDATTGEYRISYAYWFYTNTGTPGTDTLVVSISNDNGANWTTARTYTARSIGWVRDSFRIGSLVAPTSLIRVRFSAGDTSTDTVVEAGVDDFRMEKIGCAPACVADLTGNGTVNTDDLILLIGAWGSCTNCPGTPCTPDIAPPGGNCAVNTDDLILVITSWGGCPQ